MPTFSTPRLPSGGPRPTPMSEEDGVVTVGDRPSLPTIYMQNETLDGHFSGGGSNLRFRSRSDDSVPSSNGSSVRSSPAYGTPGSTFSHCGDRGTPAEDEAAKLDTAFLSPPDSSVKFVSQFSSIFPKTRWFGRGGDNGDPASGSFRNSQAYGAHGYSYCDHRGIPTDGGKLEGEAAYLSPADSGIEVVGSSPEHSPPRRNIFADEIASKNREEVESPLAYLQRQFYRSQQQRRPALFKSSTVKPHQVLPVLIVLVILASAVFTVLFLKAASTRSYSADTGDMLPSNGKHASMEFSVNRRLERLAEEGRILPHELVDEKGEALRGKRAAMQFAHEIRIRRDGGGGAAPEEVNAEQDEAEADSRDQEEVSAPPFIELKKDGLAKADNKSAPARDGINPPDAKKSRPASSPSSRQPPQSKQEFPFNKQQTLKNEQAAPVRDEDDPFRFVKPQQAKRQAFRAEDDGGEQQPRDEDDPFRFVNNKRQAPSSKDDEPANGDEDDPFRFVQPMKRQAFRAEDDGEQPRDEDDPFRFN